MPDNITTLPTAPQYTLAIDPLMCRYNGQELSPAQFDTVVWCVDNNQPPEIHGLNLHDTQGVRKCLMPGAYQPSWWHDAEPLDVWNEYTRGRFKLNMVPECMGRMIDDEAYSMGTAGEALLAGCMAAVAGALSDRMFVRPVETRPSWLESGRLWQAVIAKSGAKKSPALRTGLQPLRDLENGYAPYDAAAKTEYNVKMKRYERKVRELEKSDDALVMPDKPQHPETHRFMIYDTTVEALSEVLRNQPCGTTLNFDELSRWLAALDGNSKASADRALYLELYEGGPRKIDRIGRGLGITVPNWSGSIIGGIQPSTLQKLMRDVPIDGLLQRFYPYVCDTANKPSNDPQDSAVWERFARIIMRINRMSPGVVPVSPEARDILARTWDDLYELKEQPYLSEPLATHISKWEGGLYRWALVLHAIECAARDVEMASVPISAETARMVSLLHADLFLPNLFVLYDHILVPTQQSNHDRWIAGHILKEGMSEITERDIYRSYREFKKMDSFERLRVLESLEAQGWIQRKETHSKAVVPQQWFVNPKVHFYFEGEAEDEIKRRREIISKIRAGK